MRSHDYLICPQNFAPAISQGKKWWWRVLEREISCRKAQHAVMKGPVFSFLWGGRRRGIFSLFPMCSQCVLIKFSNGSQVLKVFPNAFLKMFPIAPGFYIIWFVQISTPMYVNWKGEINGVHLFLFRNWGPKRCFHWGHCSKFFANEPINMAPLKKSKKLWAPMI
jgi:hypothetical protein